MEQYQEFRNFCKLCNRRFHSGRSLGGHMRSHHKKIQMVLEEDGLNAEYNLRENSKIFSGVSESKDRSSKQQKHCRKCGKGFRSSKALFGHMRCHSPKFKKKRVRGTQPVNETEPPLKKKRSRRTRSKINSNSRISNKDSSYVSYESEKELQELVFCLMMLSRGVKNWGWFNLLTESSDNVSVLCGAKRLHQRKEIDAVEDKKLKKEAPELGDLDSEETKLGLGIEFSDTGTDNENEIKLIHNSIRSLNERTNKNHSLDIKTESKFLKIDSTVNSTQKEASETGYELKNSVRKHECAICFKVFSSGQALGGHKRAHLAATSESKVKQSTELQKF